MPVLVPLIITLLVIYAIALYLIPAVATVITSLLIGKVGKLTENQMWNIGTLFYFLAGCIYACMTLSYYDLKGFWAFASWVLITLFWPIPIAFIDFHQHDGGMKLKLIAIIVTFVITQLCAVIMVLNGAKQRIDKMD